MKQFQSAGLLLMIALLLPVRLPAADALLMTLQLDSNSVRWQDEFILSLEIYGAPSASPPELTIDGLDQFELRSQGKNLLQVPGGKTVKWILTYTLLARENGNFKLGPAKAQSGGKIYSSNTVFLTVEGTPRSKPAPAPVLEPPVVPPVVHSAREVGDRVLLLLEAGNPQPYRAEGFTVTLKLLSQLPVENLRFLEEAEFPGFLKYDFPYTDSPRGERATYKGESYASFDLQKFLVFPLQDGDAFLPPFRCEVTVRVPSSTYSLADPRFDLERASNPLRVKAQKLPEGTELVGNFNLRRETVSTEARSKTVQFTIEGLGLLSTFSFPEPAGSGYRARTISTSTEANILGQVLKSRAVAQVEILADDNTTDIVLPEYSIVQFNPWKKETSRLNLPAAPLSFTPPAPVQKPVAAEFPATTDFLALLAVLAAGLAVAALLIIVLRPRKRQRAPALTSLFRNKKQYLQIPKIAAQGLYQQIVQRIALRAGGEESLLDTLKMHLPESEWEVIEDRLERLESTAFSQSRGKGVTYGGTPGSSGSYGEKMAAVVKRIALITPIVLFLGLSAVFAIRGMPGKWHDRCEQFWKEQKWEEVKSLASNLLRLDEADPEVLFLAMLASEQQKDTNAVRMFGTSLLEMRALNLRWENSVASLLVPKSLMERLSLYKTRAVVAILLSITALCLVAILRRPGLSLGIFHGPLSSRDCSTAAIAESFQVV